MLGIPFVMAVLVLALYLIFHFAKRQIMMAETLEELPNARRSFAPHRPWGYFIGLAVAVAASAISWHYRLDDGTSSPPPYNFYSHHQWHREAIRLEFDYMQIPRVVLFGTSPGRILLGNASDNLTFVSAPPLKPYPPYETDSSGKYVELDTLLHDLDVIVYHLCGSLKDIADRGPPDFRFTRPAREAAISGNSTQFRWPTDSIGKITGTHAELPTMSGGPFFALGEDYTKIVGFGPDSTVSLPSGTTSTIPGTPTAQPKFIRNLDPPLSCLCHRIREKKKEHDRLFRHVMESLAFSWNSRLHMRGYDYKRKASSLYEALVAAQTQDAHDNVTTRSLMEALGGKNIVDPDIFGFTAERVCPGLTTPGGDYDYHPDDDSYDDDTNRMFYNPYSKAAARYESSLLDRTAQPLPNFIADIDELLARATQVIEAFPDPTDPSLRNLVRRTVDGAIITVHDVVPFLRDIALPRLEDWLSRVRRGMQLRQDIETRRIELAEAFQSLFPADGSRSWCLHGSSPAPGAQCRFYLPEKAQLLADWELFSDYALDERDRSMKDYALLHGAQLRAIFLGGLENWTVFRSRWSLDDARTSPLVNESLHYDGPRDVWHRHFNDGAPWYPQKPKAPWWHFPALRPGSFGNKANTSFVSDVGQPAAWKRHGNESWLTELTRRIQGWE